MRYFFILAFVAIAFSGYCGASVIPPSDDVVDANLIDNLEDDGDIEVVMDSENGKVEIAPQFVLSWQVRRFLRKLQKDMPCGFPEYGIPPLAPLKLSEADVHLEKGFVETFDKLQRFRIDGLDDFKINRFKLNMFTKKVKFDFIFKNIKASASEYETDTILDAMRQLGITVEYEGDGSLEFGLKNLRIAGELRYKLPMLWGSMKITSLKTTVTLEKCDSNINGLMGEGSINRMINRQIENLVETGINNNQQEISDLIESNLVPKANKILKGNDFWTLIDLIFSKSESRSEFDPIESSCSPSSDPWA